MADPAEDMAARVAATLRRRVLEGLANREGELDRQYAEIGARIRRDLRATGYTEREVADIVRRAFEETRERRVREIESAIHEGARQGARGDRETFRAIFGGRREDAVDAGETLEDEEEPPGVRFATDSDALVAAGARVRGETAIDSIPLSRRIWRGDQRAIDGLRRQIVASVRHGEGVQRVAERLLDATATDDGPTLRVAIPRHVEELSEAARENAHDPITGEVIPSPAFRDAATRWRSRIRALGEIDPASGSRVGAYTIRSATQDLVRRLETARAEDVDRIVDRWTLDRARYQARLVARTETVEAFRETMIEATREKPWTVGQRWTLSNRHPVPDECDLFARQNLYGLGAGGYPSDRIPPRHPADLCTITPIVDRHHFARQRARRRGDPEPPRPWEDPEIKTAADVARELGPDWTRRAIGPTRARLLEEGRDVFDHNGAPIPVHVLQGRPAPLRRTGPAVDVARLVREDRARMLAPLPPAPALAAGDDGRRRPRGGGGGPTGAPVAPGPSPADLAAAAREVERLRGAFAGIGAAVEEGRRRQIAALGSYTLEGREPTPEILAELRASEEPYADVRDFARDAAAGLTEAGKDVRASGLRDASGTRAAVRRLIRTYYPGVYSRDVAGNLTVRPGGRLIPAGGAIGQQALSGAAAHHDWNGSIVFNTRGGGIETVWRRLRALAESPDGMLETGLDTAPIGTLIHEELHGCSPMKMGAYSGFGIGVEEVTTEAIAFSIRRRITREQTSVTTSTLPGGMTIETHDGPQPAYRDFFDATTATMRAHLPSARGVPDPELWERIAQASARYKSRPREEPVRFSYQAIASWVEELTADEGAAMDAEARVRFFRELEGEYRRAVDARGR